MRFVDRLLILFKLILPLLILALLRVSPVSHAVREDLQQASVVARNHPAASVRALRDAVTREPWRSGLWEQIGRLEASAGQNGESIAALIEAEARGALSADGFFLLGETYLQEGNSAAAEQAWQRLLTRYGPSAHVFDRLALQQRARENYPGAVETLTAWRRFAPQDARAAYLLGLHLSPTDPEAALPLLIEAAQRDTQYTARVQTLRSGLAQAASSTQPAYSSLMIGRALGSISQWDLARQAFRRAVDIDPQYAEAWAFLGEARAHLGGSGMEELARARALAPQSNVVNALYALFLRRTGKPADALPYLRVIAQKEPDEPIWLVEIANTLVETGDLTAAREALEQATVIAPRDSFFWQALAQFSVQYAYDVRGVGLPAARQAVLLAPDDPAALDAMGWVMAHLGDRASAERFLQQALQNDATYAPANLHLGQVYLQQQNAGEAHFYLKIAAGLDEDGSVGDTAQRLLQRYFSEDR